MNSKMKIQIFFTFSGDLLKPRKQALGATSSFTLLHSFIPTRPKSQSTSIPKKFDRVRDHAFDNCMEIEKKTRRILQFQSLILSQRNETLPISQLEAFARRLGYKQYEAGRFVLKFPYIFDIYEHPVHRILYCRLARKALLQIEQEQQALSAQIPDAVTRLRKLLMMSNTGRLCLEHVRIARSSFGLPDDFEYSVILNHPQYFRLFDSKDTRDKYIEVVDRDPNLAVCAVDQVREREYRQKGVDAANIRFSFLVNFPPGFRLDKYYKIAVWKWQRLPYWSPYEDVSGYDLRSIEAQKRMEKRAIATIHELLSLTVEKKISLERIAHFRPTMNLPTKLKAFLLRHQGIFYISTRGNQGRLHTIFLREAYKKGQLIEPNDLYLARRKLAELVLVSPRKASMDGESNHFRRYREDDEMQRVDRDFVEDGFERFEPGNNVGRNKGGNLESDLDFTDEDVNCGSKDVDSD